MPTWFSQALKFWPIVVFVACLPHVGLAQAKYDGVCENGPSGKAQAATAERVDLTSTCEITVFLAGTTILAQIQSDESGAPKSNPFISNSFAGWSFYAAEGLYDITLSRGRVGSAVTFRDVPLIDTRHPMRARNALLFRGTDIGAKITAACADLGLGGGTVIVPATTGDQPFSNSIVPSTGCTITGQGTGATRLQWIGSGTAILAADKTRVKIENLMLRTETANSTAIKFAGCSDCSIENVYVRGEGAGRSWQVGIHVTQGTTPSANTTISRVRVEHVQDTGVQIDHAVDTFVSGSSVFAIPNSTQSVAVDINSGAGGVYIQSVSTGFGKSGLRLRHTLGTKPPVYIFADQFLADSTSGGHAVVFDSSLGNNVVSFHSTNLWAAAAGRSETNRQITPGAVGIKIEGGAQMTFDACTIRANDSDGVLIEDSDARDITFTNCTITENNQANNADAHGFHVKGAAAGIAFISNRIANRPSGHQKFGIKVENSVPVGMRVIGNDFSDNELGGLSNTNTAGAVVLGNVPGIAENVIHGDLRVDGTLQVNGKFANTPGIKRARVPITSCPAGGCTQNLVWQGGPFANKDYTVTCSVEDVTSGNRNTGLRMAKINHIEEAGIAVDIDNLSGQSLSGFLHCIAIQN